MQPKKLKIGLMHISAYESGWTEPFDLWYEQMLRQIEFADTAGLHGVWVAEHRIPGYGFASPPVFLTAAAARTRRIRLGTAVCLVSLHHPVQTAEDYAALDVLSGGRLNFGVGRGQFPYDFAVTGIDVDEGRARFGENLQATSASGRLRSPPTTVGSTNSPTGCCPSHSNGHTHPCMRPPRAPRRPILGPVSAASTSRSSP